MKDTSGKVMIPVLKLTDIFEQETAIEAIGSAYLADRLPHGLIFAGMGGIGKTTTARALGTLFLCENPKKLEPCGVCESCRVMQSNTHPDFHLITKELIRYHDRTGKSKGIELSINVVRPELIEPAARKAVMGRGKVFVVRESERMNAAAQNALLKTLEEPAGRTLIILITDQPDALLSTVRSRCRSIRFAPLSEARVLQELAKLGRDAALSAEAARWSGGSLGAAIQWIEDGVVVQLRTLVQLMEQLFGGRMPDDLPGWFKQAAEAYAGKQLERDELASKDQATRAGLVLYLTIAAEFIRRRLAIEPDPARLEDACAAIDAIARAEGYLDANVNVSLVFQQLAVALQRAVA